MNTELIIEDAFSITPKDILQKRVNPGISHWVEESRDGTFAFICADGQEPQKFGLESVEITFGTRFYFKCSCGLRVNKMYLPVNGKSFVCRKCGKFKYFLTSFNKNSIAGRQLYKMNRMQKLVSSRESMSRIIYKGAYTKKFNQFLQLCNRAGFNEAVRSAQNLMNLIKG